MGYYINNIGISYQQKVETLKTIHFGIVIDPPDNWTEDLVCVVDNISFGAAAWMNDDREFQQWKINDGRPKCWMIVPIAKQLAV